MPSKKKKYNSRFPPARIKKIMQTDEEIGKVAAAVPVLISKCLEMFLTSILTNAGEVTKSKRAKTMSTSHLKECIMNVSMFDFLKDVVANVPDMQNEEEPSSSTVVASQEPATKKATRKRPANTIGISKKPKLAASGEHELSEDSEAIGEENPNIDVEKENGLIAIKPEETVPEARSGDGSSFHISLDALMSPGDSDKSRTDQAPRFKKEETELKVSDALAGYSSMIERSDSANGVSSPQKPMDLTVNSSEARDYSELRQRAPDHARARGIPAAMQETRRKVDTTPHFQTPENSQSVPTPPAQKPGSSHNIPTPLNMPHLYNPMTSLPPAPPVAPSALTKDLDARIPQGGMLSFLYSGFPGEGNPPSKIDIREQGKEPMYPYNPVSEHYKRMSGPLHSLAIRPSFTKANQMSSLQSKEDDDDDYDV